MADEPALLDATCPGCRRDSAMWAHLFDERAPAVKTMMAGVIKTAQAKGCKIGLCGQAPSDYSEFAQFLVEQGIDHISLHRMRYEKRWWQSQP